MELTIMLMVQLHLQIAKNVLLVTTVQTKRELQK